MKIFTDPKYCMWLCRLLPPLCWIAFAIIILLINKGFENDIILSSGLIIFFIYGAFIIYFLPAILFEGNYRPLRIKYKFLVFFFGTDPFWYGIYAAATVGFGPVLWYWQKVDPVFRKMIKVNNL